MAAPLWSTTLGFSMIANFWIRSLPARLCCDLKPSDSGLPAVPDVTAGFSAVSPLSLHKPLLCPHRGALQPQGCPFAGHRVNDHEVIHCLPCLEQELPAAAQYPQGFEELAHKPGFRCCVAFTLGEEMLCGVYNPTHILLWLGHEPSLGRMEKPLHTLMHEQGMELSENEAIWESLPPS